MEEKMTEGKTIRKYRLFWAWQDDKEEAWLREMSLEGLHLASLGFPGFYYFTAGEPANYVYRLDFITESKDYQSYLQLFKDAGWEHLGRMGGWQYFRTLADEGELPEIYSDLDSKILKYRRILVYLSIFLPISVIFLSRGGESPGYPVIQMVYAVLMIIYIFAMVKLFARIQTLKHL
jgi:hypothetical protein